MKTPKPCDKCDGTFHKLVENNKFSIIKDVSRKIEETEENHEKMSARIKLLTERINSLKTSRNAMNLHLLDLKQICEKIDVESMVMKRALLSYSE